MFDLFFRRSREEVERAHNYLVENFGIGAAEEAMRLAEVSVRVGSPANARIYREVARRLNGGARPAASAGSRDDE